MNGVTMLYGLLNLSVKGYILSTLVLTQITIACVTIYLHRCQTHRALTLHPILSHFFRFWLWMTTGLRTKEWVAIHRKHHAKCETIDDPHSPIVLGLDTILLQGAEVYRAAKTKETIIRYGHGTPDDWIERHIYSHDRIGISLMLIVNVLLFGVPGVTIWAVQMMWIPLFAAGVINGIGHYYGYRNFEPNDASTNILPLAIFVGGEELHNNHHTFPSSAKFSVKWWEVDLGWLYIKVLQFLRLASVKRVVPVLSQSDRKHSLNIETLKVIINHKLQIISDFSHEVILPAVETERKNTQDHSMILAHAEKLLTCADISLNTIMKQRIASILSKNPVLAKLYQFKCSFLKIWEQTNATHQELLDALRQWIASAEMDDNPFLKRFASRLPTYSLKQTG